MNNQTADQTVKTAIIGVVATIGTNLGLSPAEVIAAVTVIGALLAAVSQKIGNPQVASFFAKAEAEVKQDAPAVADAVAAKAK